MQTDYNTYEGLRAILEKETPILIAQIRALYRELDKKFHLQGAKVPITFGFDTDSLGSYNQNGHGQKEHFHFSLFFSPNSLCRFFLSFFMTIFTA